MIGRKDGKEGEELERLGWEERQDVKIWVVKFVDGRTQLFAEAVLGAGGRKALQEEDMLRLGTCVSVCVG